MQRPNTSPRLSWAEEAKAMEEEEKKKFVWDNFDIGKISNAGFKLEFISPKVHGDATMCEIEIEDISSEIEYWKNTVVCYVLGAFPPFNVLNGYIHRLWGKHGINKVLMLRNEVMLVRFDSEVGKNEVI